MASGNRARPAAVLLPTWHLGYLLPALLLFHAFFVSPVRAAAPAPLVLRQAGVVEYTPSGPQITYDITVTNKGSEPLASVVITDVLPSGSTLLYFSTSDGQPWSSTQGRTSEGPVALWRSDAPLAAGQSVHLRYTISAPAATNRVSKPGPRARAEGFEELAPAETVVVPMTPVPTAAQPGPLPTASLAAPAVTAAPAAGSSPSSPGVLPAPSSPTSAPIVQSSPPASPSQGAPPPASGQPGSVPAAAIAVVIVGVLAVTLLILSMKKR